MNARNLAKAIVAWLHYEDLCARGHLLSEASLTNPVGEFLVSTQTRRVIAEYNYPDQQQRRGRYKQMDYALFRRGDNPTIAHLVESKLINDKRDFKLEILSDILRLESAGFTEDEGRWLIIAGKSSSFKNLARSEFNTGAGSRIAFHKVLPVLESTAPRPSNLRVADSPLILKRWIAAAEETGLGDLPLSLNVKVATFARGGSREEYQCTIWKVNSVSKRSTRSLEDLKKQIS